MPLARNLVVVAALLGAVPAHARKIKKPVSPTARFATPALHGVDGWPSELATGDLDGDGAPDLVSLALGDKSDTWLQSHLGDGAGKFTASKTTSIGDMIVMVALADLDEDGRLDVIAPRYREKDLALLAGDGKGGFAKPRHVKTGGRKPVAATAADVNADQHVDVVVAYFDHLQVFLGDGKGGLAGKPAFKVGQAPDGPVVADADADGHVDLFFVLNDENQYVLMRGASDGTFVKSMREKSCGSPSYPQAGDFDNDGAIDFAYACLEGQLGIELLLSRKGGQSYDTGWVTADPIEDFIAADFTGDGTLDLLSSGRPPSGSGLSSQLRLHTGDGTGGFTLACEGQAAAHAAHPIAGDFDQDQRGDVMFSYWPGREPGFAALWSSPCR